MCFRCVCLLLIVLVVMFFYLGYFVWFVGSMVNLSLWVFVVIVNCF